jgi:signal transduction histidine kinase
MAVTPAGRIDPRIDPMSTEEQRQGKTDGSGATSAHQSFLATATPDASERRWAIVAIVLSIVAFGAIAPFAKTHLTPLAAFIPGYEAALTIIDLLTGVLLLSQFTILRRPSLLVVACAYLLNTVLVAAHALSFPGIFADRGLFGDAQTTAWLYVFWHMGFPVLLGVYALLADSRHDHLAPHRATDRVIAVALGLVLASAAAVIALATFGTSYLPIIIDKGDYSRLVTTGVSPAILVLCAGVIARMWHRRSRTIMDVWLVAVLWVWICDVSLSAVVGSFRYDLGWYGGRLFGLFAASFVLVALLFEFNKLYARLSASVSEAHARNEELVRSRGELARAQRMEALGQLTGGIAHDFNNLLTAITGGLEMIARRPDDPDRVLRIAGNASKAADRGAQLIRRLMSFARKQNLRPEVLDANSALRDFWNLATSIVPPQITIRLALEEVGTICVDVGEFQAAFLNLISNARDSMPNGGEIVIGSRVVVLTASDLHETEAKPGKYVQIRVTDQGAGMSPDVQAHMFEPFFTTKSLGLGTGLGLSQVYGFTHSAGGQIVVVSAEGRGTVMKLNLPLSTAMHIERQQVPMPLEGQVAQGTSVLLVEDDDDVLITTKDRVEELGYVVITATSGDEAFDLLSKGLTVDAVFSDIVMPGKLNGVQLAEAVHRIRPQLKLVLTSGYTGSALDQFKLPKDFIFLAKPYSQKDLADKLVAATTK